MELLLGLVTALLGGSALAALASYLLGRRQSSGQIATSDAATLWAESQAMRQELRSEVGSLRTEVNDLKTQVRNLETRLRRYENGGGK